MKKPPSHLVNSALLELHLCGNAFDSGVVKIQEVLDPLRNGSSGATASTVNVVFARNTTDSSFSRSVLMLLAMTMSSYFLSRSVALQNGGSCPTGTGDRGTLQSYQRTELIPELRQKQRLRLRKSHLSGSKSSLKIITLLGRRCPGVWVILFEVYFFTAWRVATPSYRRIGSLAKCWITTMARG